MIGVDLCGKVQHRKIEIVGQEHHISYKKMGILVCASIKEGKQTREERRVVQRPSRFYLHIHFLAPPHDHLNIFITMWIFSLQSQPCLFTLSLPLLSFSTPMHFPLKFRRPLQFWPLTRASYQPISYILNRGVRGREQESPANGEFTDSRPVSLVRSTQFQVLIV